MYTQIHAWLNRMHPLPRRFRVASMPDRSDGHWLAWVGIQEAQPLHEAADLNWRTLAESSEYAKTYVSEDSNLLGSDQVEEDGDKASVIESLGMPPPQAAPLYIISLRDNSGERVVYVGKTTTDSRFAGGHLAALRLHAPKYMHSEKWIYRCSVTLSLGGDHVALEWVEPSVVAGQILDDVESRLIFALQPELNIKKTVMDCAGNKCAVHMQNVVVGCRTGSFLNDFILSHEE